MIQPHTAIFLRRVWESSGTAPPTVAADSTADAVLSALARSKGSSVLVLDSAGELAGIVTEQDVVRRISGRDPATVPVPEIMSKPVQVIRNDDRLFRAIARMRRAGLRHMPVVDAAGRPVGLLNLDKALAAAIPGVIAQIERLTRDDTITGMRDVRDGQAELARDMLNVPVPAPDIQALLSHINNDIYRRVAERARQRMEEDGFGPAPVAFCLLVMGSGGRRESHLNPDQDNGLVIEDYPDDRHGEIDPWFREFSDRLTSDMDALGVPLCEGNVMATNPVWRKTLGQWQGQLEYWMLRRSDTTLRLGDIFFDFRPIYGETALGETLRDRIREALAGNNTFIRALYVKDEERGQNVALGWFDRFIVEKRSGPNRGKINLKLTGTLPLVSAVRAFALHNGVTETGTLARIKRLGEAGVFDADETDYLRGAFRHITGLLLREQTDTRLRGLPAGNYVHPDSMSRRERDALVFYFKAIRALRERLRSELTGDIF